MHQSLLERAGRVRVTDRQFHADLHVCREGLLLGPAAQGRVDGPGADRPTVRVFRRPIDVGEVALEDRPQVHHRVAGGRLGQDGQGGQDLVWMGPPDYVVDRALLIDGVPRLRLHQQQGPVELLPLHRPLIQWKVGVEPAAGHARREHEELAQERRRNLTEEPLLVLALDAVRIGPEREQARRVLHPLGDLLEVRIILSLFRGRGRFILRAPRLPLGPRGRPLARCETADTHQHGHEQISLS